MLRGWLGIPTATLVDFLWRRRVESTEVSKILEDAKQLPLAAPKTGRALFDTEQSTILKEGSGVGRSFDLFDTLIARRCVYPTEIFNKVEQTSKYPNFARMRIAAEAQIATGHYTIHDIYRSLVEHNNIPAGEAERLKSLELQIEEDNLFPIAQHCQELNSTDIVVSDMYLPFEWLNKLLRDKFGLRPRQLYLYSNGKRDGTVWPRIKETMKITEHVGDNPVTDKASAQAAGIPARLTTVARRTDIEEELASAGYLPLANLIREARLTTWHGDPAMRRAQVTQLQVNFPLLFLATLHLKKLSDTVGWDLVLMSARDCYLWHELYHQVSSLIPDLPKAIYLYSNRTIRAHPSPSYLAYLADVRTGQYNVIVDLCGTGWSLSRLLEQAPGPRTDIFLIHKIELPHLLKRYKQFGPLVHPINPKFVVARPPQGADSNVLEDLNLAPHAAVEDVRQSPTGFLPVFSSLPYPEQAVQFIQIQHAVFRHACTLVKTLTSKDVAVMLEGDTALAIEARYRHMAGQWSNFAWFHEHKQREEILVWERLKKNSEQMMA